MEKTECKEIQLGMSILFHLAEYPKRSTGPQQAKFKRQAFSPTPVLIKRAHALLDESGSHSIPGTPREDWENPCLELWRIATGTAQSYGLPELRSTTAQKWLPLYPAGHSSCRSLLSVREHQFSYSM